MTNQRKSKVRAKTEHAFLVIKRIFGFTKLRYRWLAKNANRFFVTCVLANLFVARRQLMRLHGRSAFRVREIAYESNKAGNKMPDFT